MSAAGGVEASQIRDDPPPAVTAPSAGERLGANQPAVRVEGLVRRFGDRVAVDGLSFQVGRGETVGLLGHNGAGKTTTIRLLDGVLSADAGRITVLGLDPSTDGVRIRARSGVLTETPSLDERLSAGENLEFYGRLHGLDGDDLRDRVRAMLGAFGLLDRIDQRTGGFSRGMKQRVALARTLLHDPDILFLDEPTAALDPVAAREVHELVEAVRRDEKRTVILCTHNLVEAQRLCDRVVIMQQGRAIAIGSPAELAGSVLKARTVEVEVAPDDRQLALRTLRAAGFDDMAAAPDGLTLQGATRDTVAAAVAALAAAGVAIYRVAPDEPDLEAAYFAIHEGRAGEPSEPAR